MMQARHGPYAVAWDGEFQFGVEPSDAFEVNDVAPASAVGAAFLSGRSFCSVLHVSSDGKTERYSVFNSTVQRVQDPRPRQSKHAALCGDGVANPRIVSDVCRRSDFKSMSVTPFTGPQAAFGWLCGRLMLQGKERPRMTRFCSPWDESVEGQEGLEFDPNLEGDGYGKMAHLVQAHTPVLNQMMRGPSIPVFYGRVLSCGGWWGTPIFLMRPLVALKYFPTESLLVRNYAASWVPVSVENTEEFSKATGYGGSEVQIFVASEMTPELGTFLRFFESMCPDDVVASSNPQEVKGISRIPLFRHQAAYNISKEQFKEVSIESG